MGLDHTPTRRRRLDVEPFGVLEDGRAVDLFVLTTSQGIEVRLTNYGGIVVAVRTPDRAGNLDDVVLGFDQLRDYVRDTGYQGCLIGRYANRIANGHFVLEDEPFSLEKNDGEHHLHGGPRGFHKSLWGARPFEDDRGSGVELDHRSVDGDGGYPGNLSVNVTYVLTDGGELAIDYRARSDRDTVVNLTQHSYFNLDGAVRGDILDHEVVLRARRFTPTDSTLIPTGELRDVAGTAFDFVAPRRIGSRIGDLDEQLLLAGGYDHNWILDESPEMLRPVARALSPSTGRMLEIWTTEPGLQFYTGNSLCSDSVGRASVLYTRRAGFCMEPQHFPDSPNNPQFPSTILRKGELYRSTTVYRFSTLHASADLKADW
jgi:aldose 1-epimerase